MFLNLKGNVLTVNSYRFADAAATTQDDLLKCHEDEDGECLCAIIENVLTIDKDPSGNGYFSTYTGITDSEEFSNFEVAHGIHGDNKENIISKADVWGINKENCKIYFEGELV